MPCRYDPGPNDYLRDERQKNEKLMSDLDRLTHQNDQYREALLNMINDRGYNLPADVVADITVDQTAHRQEDLDRLEKYCRTILSEGATHVSIDGEELTIHEVLGRVVTADPSKTLEPQLGFDPNEF